jgi:hypothetical protein
MGRGRRVLPAVRPARCALRSEDGRHWDCAPTRRGQVKSRRNRGHRALENARRIDYAEYAGAGLYMNLCGTGCRDKIADLDGERSIADALSALLASQK